jgi:hypothetical protein
MKSLVLGKARVMSYENLEATRIERIKKQADKAAKSKWRQKRKGGAEKSCMSGTRVGAVQIEAPELTRDLFPVRATTRGYC